MVARCATATSGPALYFRTGPGVAARPSSTDPCVTGNPQTRFFWLTTASAQNAFIWTVRVIMAPMPALTYNGGTVRAGATDASH
jgi:hypothetical protein